MKKLIVNIYQKLFSILKRPKRAALVDEISGAWTIE
jgi:hypothetical protein